MADAIVIHTNEIVLKKGNRSRFEKKLLKTIQVSLNIYADFTYERRPSGIFIQSKSTLTKDQENNIQKKLERIFGIAHFTFATRCTSDINAIKHIACDYVPEGARFRVTTKRSDKSFPQTSQDISRDVGGYLLAHIKNSSVDLHTPEYTVFIEISNRGTYITGTKHSGPGGLPTGTAGRVVSLLSGGIDSPVATWKVMRRGVEVVMVHFHSYPHVGKESIEKVKTLAKIVGKWQGGGTVIMMPLAEIQREIVAKCDPRMRILLYRRQMLRLAERIAKQYDAQALVTGDSIGQVSSQTLENLRTVSSAVSLPIFRPLIGDDKMTIVETARKISTYETSIEPHEDCCSLFLPPNPLTRSTSEQAEREEEKIHLTNLLDDAIASLEEILITEE